MAAHGASSGMDIRIIGREPNSTKTALETAIRASSDVRIAVAFASLSGVDLVRPALDEALGNGGEAEFIVGLDMFVTEPAALLMLYEMSRLSNKVHLYCYSSPSSQGIYHPKLYLLLGKENAFCLVGSSNLTRPGLTNNREVNALIKGPLDSEAINDAMEAYNSLKFAKGRVIPDSKYLGLYSDLYRHQRKRAASCDPALLKAFREQETQLRAPQPQKKDLVGWTRLVYDALPDDVVFSASEAYKYAGSIASRYPANSNVDAKIRQSLQVLRDRGLVEHVSHNRWRKLQQHPSAS